MIDYTSLRKSLALLQSQYTHYSTMDTDLAPYLQEALTESVIQRFEACYDCLWKVLKRYLVEELGLVNTPNSPRGVWCGWPLKTTCCPQVWKHGLPLWMRV